MKYFTIKVWRENGDIIEVRRDTQLGVLLWFEHYYPFFLGGYWGVEKVIVYEGEPGEEE